MRPSARSRSAFLMFTALQLLTFLRGVKRWAYRSSSTPRATLSIQPKQTA
jgi:hypothetical protein